MVEIIVIAQNHCYGTSPQSLAHLHGTGKLRPASDYDHVAAAGNPAPL